MANSVAERAFKNKRRKSKFPTLDQRRFSGSLVEGGFSAAWFKPDSTGVDTLDFDLDFEITIGKMPPSAMNHCIVDNGKGFALVKYNDRCKLNNKRENEIHLINQMVNGDGFLMPYALKSYLINPKKNAKAKFFISPKYIRQWLTGISIDEFSERVTKATYQQIYLLKIPKKFQLLLNFDLGITIQLDWQTDYMKRWIKRKRKWPDISLMRQELKTTYLIAKCPGDEKANPDSIFFRYSFSHIEQKIVSMQSESQRIVYYIAKAIFYKHVKSIDPDKIQSFLLKNTMLWICETLPPANDTWSYSRVIEAVDLLLQRLGIDLCKGYMPYYFIPEINVLELYSKKLLVQMDEAVVKIRLNVGLRAEQTYSKLPKEVLSFLIDRLNGFYRYTDLIMSIRDHF